MKDPNPANYLAKPYIALLGGGFNPPHIGHLRMLIEVQEQIRPAKTLLLPCASPPHKPSLNLLPFKMRKELLNFIINTLPNTEISGIEETLPLPS
ncbi:MAG: nicotinate-nicotinamide nucleotide adenylyltransferase, partial [Candidatus Adiutrix sp.]